ncbi:MAG: redoxin family protein [Acidobacteria bacterium]|nr:redoxin family protein [Acidobacteriota bacterium]
MELGSALRVIAILMVASRCSAADDSIQRKAIEKANEWITLEQSARGGGPPHQQVLNKIEKFLSEHPDEEWVYAAVAHGFNRLDRNLEALALLRKYRTRFAESAALDKTLEFFYFTFGELADLRSLPERFHTSPHYWTTLMRKAAKAGEPEATVIEAARRALDAMNRENDPDGDRHCDLAESLLSMNLAPGLAEEAARQSLKSGEVTRPMDHLLPTLPPETMRMALRMFRYRVYRSTLAWALAAQGRNKEAREELRKAVRMVEDKHLRTARVFYRLAQIHERLNEKDSAVAAYIREIATGGDSGAARKEIARLSPGERFAERINEESALWALADPDNLEVEEMNAKLGRFELKDRDGKAYSVDALKGKIVSLDFWASWCVSCRPSLASSDELQREFPEDVVVVAPAGDSEDTQDKAVKFLAERGYRRFVLLVDDPALRDLPTPWIPVRFAIDRAGRVRVRELGASEQGIATFEEKLRALVRERR